MRTNKIILLLIIAAAGIIVVYMQVFQKNVSTDTGHTYSISEADFKEGRRLAKKYCSSCHLYPEPDLLSGRTWKLQTLPYMGPQLGIFEHKGVRYPIERTPNLPDNYYPPEPLVSHEEWQKILDFYVRAAPEELPPAEKDMDIITDPLFFKARAPDYRPPAPPLVTSIRFDPGNKLIYLSDASHARFLVFDKNLDFKDRYDLTSAISDIRIVGAGNNPGEREFVMTFIGDVNPSDAPSGFIQNIWYDPAKEQGGAGAVLYDSLARPVESRLTDLNQDGMKDLLISEFGHRTGGLFWLENTGEGMAPEKNVLINTPGCIQSHITDVTGDHLPDVLALCTQYTEAIYLFRNQGKGSFIRDTLLQFPVTAGSSSFELHDFNGDEYLDILYTSGDNADYSITYKPYHGVYIYVNDGNDNFEQAWFYPINGAYDAKARDFDRDGNLDIAVISFFADYENSPEEGFVLFKGEGNLMFTPYHHPATSAGRWIAMDVADWDRDGDDDIVLANYSVGPTRVIARIQNKWAQGPQFLLLENTSADGEVSP